MTGGGRGWCARKTGAAAGGPGYGRGRGRGGRGFGGGARFGWGAGNAAPASSLAVSELRPLRREDSLAALRAEAERARDRLAEIEQRIATMETEDVE